MDHPPVDSSRWSRRCFGALLLAVAFAFVGEVAIAQSKAPPAKPWTKLENCRLLPNKSNDGDSFHVEHEKQEYIFRLYFVDSPETEADFPERVSEQAAYFGISNEQALALGKDAASFTSKRLAGTLTIHTRFRNALVRSKLPRSYAVAMIGTDDLAELLVRNGLARIYGTRTPLPDGSDSKTYLKKLKLLEQSARKAKIGAWRLPQRPTSP